MYDFLFSASIILLLNQVMIEYCQYMKTKTGWDYFFSGYNWVDMVYLMLNFVLICLAETTIDIEGMIVLDVEFYRTIASISTVFIWIKMIDWLRLFEGTAFFVHLIIETIRDIKNFLIVIAVCYMTFGTSFYLLDYNRDTSAGNIVETRYNWWVLDAFESQYELSLNLKDLDPFAAEDENKKLIFTFWIISSFILIFVFLSMLVAIMSDTFNRVTENKEQHARYEKLSVMGDYIEIIERREDQEDDFKDCDDFDGSDSDDDKGDDTKRDDPQTPKSQKESSDEEDFSALLINNSFSNKSVVTQRKIKESFKKKN